MRPLIAVALAAASSWAIAQPSSTAPPAGSPRPATIEVTGQAKVSETPDRVYIDIGATTQAQKSEVAAAQNARRISMVMAAVKRVAGPTVQLTTTQYSISANYNYPRNGGAATIVGYDVSDVVQVRLDDLHRIGPVIDAAAQAGSNSVQDIRFELRDEQSPREEALRRAVLNARQDAGALADALGLRVVRVLSVSEQSPTVVPILPQVRTFAARVEAAPATPVEVGTIEVNAAITLTVEVAPATR